MTNAVYIVTGADFGALESMKTMELIEHSLTAPRAVYSTFEKAKAYVEKDAKDEWLDFVLADLPADVTEQPEWPGLEWFGTINGELVWLKQAESPAICEEWEAVMPDADGTADLDAEYAVRYRITRVFID